MTEYNCDTCQIKLTENDLFHEYKDDGIVVCDDCHKYTLHDLGRTG